MPTWWCVKYTYRKNKNCHLNDKKIPPSTFHQFHFFSSCLSSVHKSIALVQRNFFIPLVTVNGTETSLVRENAFRFVIDDKLDNSFLCSSPWTKRLDGVCSTKSERYAETGSFIRLHPVLVVLMDSRTLVLQLSVIWNCVSKGNVKIILVVVTSGLLLP